MRGIALCVMLIVLVTGAAWVWSSADSASEPADRGVDQTVQQAVEQAVEQAVDDPALILSEPVSEEAPTVFGASYSGEQPALPTNTGPMPPVRLDPLQFDAGRIDPEALINATFRVINTSNQTMTIDGFTTSCKCTAPVISARVIPPGGDVEVSATVDLRGTYGKIQKSFMLKFRGYDRMVECVIKANMSHEVVVEPDKLRRFSGTVRLTASDGRPFAPIAIHNKDARYRFVPVRPAGAERAVVWDVAYALPPGSPDTNLLIETDHRKAKLLSPRMFVSQATEGELKYILQRKEIWSERKHANLGGLNQGDHFDLGCQIRMPSHAEGLEVFTETEGIEAQIVGMEDIPGEDDSKMYTVRLTNTGAAVGAVLTPLYFATTKLTDETGETFRTRAWIMALVHESDESAVTPEGTPGAGSSTTQGGE